MVSFITGSLLSFLQLVLLFHCATAWASFKLSRQPLHIRCAAVTIVTFWLSALIFAALIPTGHFNKVTTTAVLLLFSVGASRRYHTSLSSYKFFREVTRAARIVGSALPTWLCLAGAGTLIIFLVLFSRGIIAPPLAWDALTYHLLKAGRWVQSGRWVFDSAPDAWQIYEWLPPLGDVYFSWAMLGSHSDAWLAWLGAAVWFNALLAVYALARSIQLDPKVSCIAAITTASAPAILAFVTANYVDSTAFVIVTMGSALLITGARDRSPLLLAISAVGMAMGVGIKITFLPYFIVSGTFLLWYVIAQRQGMLFVFATFAILPCFAWQGYLVSQGKTPFFPTSFSLFGVQVEPGQPEFLKYLYTSVDLAYAFELPISIRKFLINRNEYAPGHYNFTWTFPLVLLFGLLGSYQFLKSQPWRVKAAYGGVLVAGSAIFVSFWTPDTSYYRAVWVENLGRFFTTFYSIMIIATLVLWNRTWPLVFGFLLTVNLYEVWPRAWILLDYQALALGFGTLLFATGLYWIMVQINSFPRRVLGIISAAVGLIIFVYCARDVYRYRFYRAGSSYDIYYPATLIHLSDSASYLDTLSGKTIAFSMAHEPISYRWFRYIFLGSRLQNQVVYVSPTASGATWSQSTTTIPPVLRYDLWKKRLKQQGVDYYFSTIPYPPEAHWAAEHPESFDVQRISSGRIWILLGHHD